MWIFWIFFLKSTAPHGQVFFLVYLTVACLHYVYPHCSNPQQIAKQKQNKQQKNNNKKLLCASGELSVVIDGLIVLISKICHLQCHTHRA